MGIDKNLCSRFVTLRSTLIILMLAMAALCFSGCKKALQFQPEALARIGTINSGTPLRPYMLDTQEVHLPLARCPVLPINEVPFTLQNVNVVYTDTAEVAVDELELNSVIHYWVDPAESDHEITIDLYTRRVFDHVVPGAPVPNPLGFPDFPDDRPLDAQILLSGRDIHGNAVYCRASVRLSGDVAKGENPNQ